MDYAFGWETVGGFQRTFEENGRPDRAEDLDAAQHQRLRALPRPDPTRRRRRLRAVRGPAGASVHEAVRGRRAQGQAAAPRRRDHDGRVRSSADGRRGARRGHRAALLRGARRMPRTRSSPRPSRPRAGKSASYFSEAGYTGMRWIVEAIKASGGKVEDREQFLAVAAQGRSQGCAAWPPQRGPVGQPGGEHLRAQVEKVGGKLVEHRDRHLSRRQPVLEVQPRGVHEAAALHARLSAVQALLRATP